MRTSLLLVVLLLPTVGAVQSCDDVVCASAGTARVGSGSCEQGAPAYTEVTEATVIVGIAAQTYVSVFSDCYRHDEGGSSRGHRELAAVGSVAGREASLYWWQSENDGGSLCRIRADAGPTMSAPCVAGGPPMLPRLP